MDLVDLAPNDATAALSSNPIPANSPVEREWWNQGVNKLRFPRGTRIFLSKRATSSVGVEQRSIVLHKPRFFRISIEIEAVSPDFRPLPAGIAYPSPTKIKNHCYRIRMEARFDWLTAANVKRADYKSWAEWLMKRLKEKSMMFLANA